MTSPLSVALNSSISFYTARIVAVNCNGESSSATLTINLSECHIFFDIMIINLVSAAINLLSNDDTNKICLGNIVSFNCSVYSLFATTLTWALYLPATVPLIITYNDTSSLTRHIRNVTSTLTAYEAGNFIQSVISWRVIEGALLECIVEDFKSVARFDDPSMIVHVHGLEV